MQKLFVVVVFLLLAGTLAVAQTLPLMAGRSHDFRWSGLNATKGGSEKLCGYCHTPHVPATGIKAPLWSRAKLASTGYGVYNNAISTTMNADPTALEAGQDNISSMCMSCHDGSFLFAEAAYVKRPRTATGGTWDETMTVGDEANLHTGTVYGTGLSHTHPVNFVYNAALATLDGGLQNAPLNNLPLYNGYMQCGSCHNPHLSGAMTRVTTDNGSLCISCHNK